MRASKLAAENLPNLVYRYLVIGTILIIGLVIFISHAEAAGAATASAVGQDAANSDDLQRKKVLYVNSYHWGYEWSDGITRSICNALGASVNGDGEVDSTDSTISLKIFYMDTKRNSSEEYITEISLKAKALIDEWQPDVVITSDDNAAKYLIAPYYKNAVIPFVFCGINWDSSEYGLPCSNVTGMIEVQLIDQLLNTLKKYASGDRIAFLKGDDSSARKEAAQYERVYGIALDAEFVMNFEQWKEQYIRLQNDADILLLGNSASIAGWDWDEAKRIVNQHTRVPTGNWDSWMAALALVTFATKPEEQGEWAAAAALQILAGKLPADIHVVENKTAMVLLNMRLAKKLGIIFPMDLIRHATFVSE